MTIREAAWLTDGTYKYEEVVRCSMPMCKANLYANLFSNIELGVGGVTC